VATRTIARMRTGVPVTPRQATMGRVQRALERLEVQAPIATRRAE